MISKLKTPSWKLNLEVPKCIITSEIKKALKGMSRGKAGGADGLPIDLIRMQVIF